MNKEEIDGVCKGFVDKICEQQGFENQMRYVLEDFLFENGWSSKDNKKHGKKGYSHYYSYRYADLRHFVEDVVRWSVHEVEKIHKTELARRV